MVNADEAFQLRAGHAYSDHEMRIDRLERWRARVEGALLMVGVMSTTAATVAGIAVAIGGKH